eukprot:6388021-Karenia_brevis.AAC.1
MYDYDFDKDVPYRIKTDPKSYKPIGTATYGQCFINEGDDDDDDQIWAQFPDGDKHVVASVTVREFKALLQY